MTDAATHHAALPGPELIPERYQVTQLLGRGGMACVYRARDLASGRELALKHLSSEQDAPNRDASAGLFEREFHTLAQLHHPHVIEVYDYGLLRDGSPFYTMELLDGGDLRERAPLPWREVCSLFFEVCSSLALLHSRRLLHRDISPRNIRCTHAGRAKLIDFGALAPMNSGGADVVGTPAFVAPETLHRLALDARTDLFSLGATLYHALTGHLPYAARTFADALAAWKTKVVAPSAWTPDVPAALDDLVLALISVEPALRPQSAFEVMQRLAAIAGLESTESEAVSRAYLATPSLVGREPALAHFREQLLASRMARGGAIWLQGPAGVGRSRMLDACALEAKTLGFGVLRATASAARAGFSTVHALTRHLLEALSPNELSAAPAELFQGEPTRANLRDFTDRSLDSEQLQETIRRFWLNVGRKRPLLFAVDDVQRIDAQSAAVLAALLDKSRRAGIFVALSAASDAPASEACAALARRCSVLELEPLSRADTQQLLGSLFGDAPHLDMLSDELHAISAGNPRQCMEAAQHLVDRGVIRYAAGTWTLPSRLESADLPRDAGATKRAQLDALGATARCLAECQALAFYESLRDADYRALVPQASSGEIEEALAELLRAGILNADGASYALSNRLWTTAIQEALDPAQLAERERALAHMYQPSSRVAFIHHAFRSGLDQEGLEALLALNAEYAAEIDHARIIDLNIGKMMASYPRAHQAAERLGKSLRVRNELRRWHLVGTATLNEVSFPEPARAWFSQLERDSGLDLYRQDPDLMRALSAAQARYVATPESERVYSVEEAIRLLAEYVVFCIVIAARSQDNALLRTLPPILEPFAVLSPVLDAIWQNALATYESGAEGAFERARERWLRVLTRLDEMTDSDVKYAKEIANAIAFGIGCMEAQLGLASATTWAERLERDVYQRVSALQLRRIERLEHGDSKSAERLRRQAEVLTLQSRGPQMFNALLMVELSACAKATDLAGVRDALERIRPLAARYPGWRPNLRYAQGSFHFVRGDYLAAQREYADCIALTAFDAEGASPNATMWFAAHVGASETWLALGQAQEARAVALRALEQAERCGKGSRAVELVRVLALAEAKLGEPGAAARLEASIAEQNRIGSTGLQLGLSYEARAQIAIWQADPEAFEHYAELTAREYRYGADSGLGARYTRLINEAGRHGLRARAALADFASLTNSAFASTQITRDDPNSLVMRTLSRTRRADERARAALELICASRNAGCGHLYALSETGLVLSASQGDPAPLPDLDVVHEFVARSEDREGAIDDMATGALIEERPASLVDVDGTSYELLLLSCVVDGEAKVAGVAAVAASGAPVDALRQTQLLQALASHLHA